MFLPVRVWDIVNKKMIYSVVTIGTTHVSFIEEGLQHVIPIEQVIINKSSEKTRIDKCRAYFEGDIVKLICPEEVIGVIKFGEYTAPVENSINIGFYIQWVNESYRDIFRVDLGGLSNKLVTLGNIYENSNSICNKGRDENVHN